MDEGLVAVEESVPAGQQIAFEPAFALVLAEHLHDPAGRGEVLVVGNGGGIPLPLGHFEQGFEPVGNRLVGPEDAEVALRLVELGHVTQEGCEHPGVADAAHPARPKIDPVVAKVRHVQVTQQDAAVGMRIRAHAALALGCELGQLRSQATVLIEEFLRPVALQPLLQQREVLGMRGRIGERHLV